MAVLLMLLKENCKLTNWVVEGQRHYALWSQCQQGTNRHLYVWGLGPRTSTSQILTGQRTTQSHLWIYVSFNQNGGEKCTTYSHLSPIPAFVSMAAVGLTHRHLHTSTCRQLYTCPHPCTGNCTWPCPPVASMGLQTKVAQSQTIA